MEPFLIAIPNPVNSSLSSGAKGPNALIKSLAASEPIVATSKIPPRTSSGMFAALRPWNKLSVAFTTSSPRGPSVTSNC